MIICGSPDNIKTPGFVKTLEIKFSVFTERDNYTISRIKVKEKMQHTRTDSNQEVIIFICFSKWKFGWIIAHLKMNFFNKYIHIYLCICSL